MSDITINPRAVVGDNRPQTSSVIQRLVDDYGQFDRTVSGLLETARSLGETVENERDLEGFSNVIVAIRDAGSRAEAARAAEKEPYLRGGQAVDGFFSSIKERLEKARRVLQRRVDDYQNAKLAREREQRRLEAAQREREAREAREREENARREAESARLAAERARKPEKVAEKTAAADTAEQGAAAAAAAASTALGAAEAARIETLRKSSEIARSRFDEGRLVTMRQVGYVELVDRDAIDMNALRPYFTEAEIAKALRGWAKATGYSKPMPGATVGMRDEAVVR